MALSINDLKQLSRQLFQNNISQQIEPVHLRTFFDEVLEALAENTTPTKENAGVAVQLVNALLGGAGNDANTLFKLRGLISTLNSQVAGKENAGVATQLIADLKGDVPGNRDTLKKLSDAIDGLISVERNVADIAARNTLSDKRDQQNVYVANASADPTVSGGWAIYKYILATTSWIKIAEGESIDVDFSQYATKTAGELEIDYTPSENDNANGFFAGLLTSGKLKIRAALNKIVAVLKTKADLVNGKVPASQLPPVAPASTAGIPAYNQVNAFLIGEQALSGARYWQAKINIAANTQNSAPPTDPGVTENTHWLEISSTHLQNTDTALKRSTGQVLSADIIHAGIVPTVLASSFGGGTLSINLDNARIFTITLTGNITGFTFTGGVADRFYWVRLIQDTTGFRTIDGVDAKLKVRQNRILRLSTGPGEIDTLELEYIHANHVIVRPDYAS